jgi:hypothetical protein
MCDDHEGQSHTSSEAARACRGSDDDGLTRRRLLQGIGAMAGTGLLLGPHQWTRPAFAAPPSADGLTARSMAMHVHSSFSEGGGSMESQLFEASRNSVDVVWWTDHDWKMRARGFKQRVHFTSLTDERTDAAPWKWIEQRTGSLTSRSRGGLKGLNSPNDPIESGSLLVSAKSTSTSLARLGFVVDGSPSHDQRVNAYGQVWTLDVLPLSIGRRAYLELVIQLSHHPARAGRPAGAYQLTYRFGGRRAPGSRVAEGIRGVVTLPVTVGEWNTVSATLSDDIAALWPDIDPRDFATVGLSLHAASEGRFAKGHFDYLRISRPLTTGDVPLQLQQEIGAGYAAAYPEVAQRRGLEVSLILPHVNWFGGAVTIPTFNPGQGSTWEEFLGPTVEQIHLAGGLASYNHPFGASNPSSALAQSAQDAAMTALASKLIQNKALGTDMLEVGYPQRAGYDIAHHLGLWDTLSRNALFLTGTGVNDDHGGVHWSSLLNNWITWAWSSTDSEADLLDAMRAGRAWATSIKSRTSLDLLVDEVCPMGSVSVSSVSQRTLRVVAADLPPGGAVRVLRGVVDGAGTNDPWPNTTTIATLDADDLTAGSVTMPVDTRSPCFVRLSVTDSNGIVVAVSNPVWMLRSVPSSGIPAARLYEVSAA